MGDMDEDTFAFEAPLWLSESVASWAFVTLPVDLADELRWRAGPPNGFGSVRVEVGVGSTTWRTSVFPDKTSGSYVLPLKVAVRRAEGLEAGDQVAVALQVLGSEMRRSEDPGPAV